MLEVLQMWGGETYFGNHYPFSLTNFMEQSPSWESNSFSASQEIPHLLYKQKIHKCLPLVPILNQMNLNYIVTPYLHKTHFNAFLQPCLGLPSGLFTSNFLTKILYEFLISPMCTTCSAHLILLLMTTLIVFIKWNIINLKSDRPGTQSLRVNIYEDVGSDFT
jgi:hypothetical protein